MNGHLILYLFAIGAGCLTLAACTALLGTLRADRAYREGYAAGQRSMTQLPRPDRPAAGGAVAQLNARWQDPDGPPAA